MYCVCKRLHESRHTPKMRATSMLPIIDIHPPTLGVENGKPHSVYSYSCARMVTRTAASSSAPSSASGSSRSGKGSASGAACGAERSAEQLEELEEQRSGSAEAGALRWTFVKSHLRLRDIHQQ